MTTAVSDISYETPAPRKGAIASQWLQRNIWPLSDQILISASNFITMVLAARAMQQSQFGTFTVVYSALLLANVLQSTLVTQAHNVIGTSRSGADYKIYTTTTAVGQLIFIAIEALIASAIAVWAYTHHSEHTALLIALVPAIVGWQLQEFVRRVLYTEDKLAAAFLNDVVSYGGQTVWVAVLWYKNSLTGPGALYALAWTSIAAALLGAWQMRASFSSKLDFAVLVENWHFGKWLAGAEIIGWCSNLQMYLWLAAWILGSAAAGELRAAQLMFGPTRVLAFFLGNILPIRFAAALKRGGDAEMHSGMRKVCAAVVPMLGAYCLFAAIFAGPLLRVMYGGKYGDDASVLQLYALCAFMNYMQMVVAAALAAKRLTHLIFVSSIYGGMIALAMSWFLIKACGTDGAILCMMVSAIIVSVLYWRAYGRNVDTTSAHLNVQEAGLSS